MGGEAPVGRGEAPTMGRGGAPTSYERGEAPTIGWRGEAPTCQGRDETSRLSMGGGTHESPTICRGRGGAPIVFYRYGGRGEALTYGGGTKLPDIL